MTDAELKQALDAPYALTEEQKQSFRENGFIKLKHVFPPELLEHYGSVITSEVRRLNTLTKPMEERTTYERAFLQIMNLWRESDVAREFVFGKRLARLAAELMGVDGVRLYHDQALYKEPSGGFTPWHADQYYWPLSTPNTCTAWIPLQDTPLEMGPLAFSVASHKHNVGRDLEISDDSEAMIGKSLADQGLPVDEAPFQLGEVSFHYGWLFHRAGPNESESPRRVMTIIYMEDGIRLLQPTNAAQQSDRNSWMSGTAIGDPVATPLNPVLYTG